MTKERLEKIKTLKAAARAKTKGKGWQNLSTKDKDDKLKSLCLLFGLYEEIK